MSDATRKIVVGMVLVMMLSAAEPSHLQEEPFEVIVAGHGTTATHSFYYELCAANLSSVHYGLNCNGKSGNKGEGHHEFKGRGKFFSQYRKVLNSMKDAPAHQKVQRPQKMLSQIESKTRDLIQMCKKERIRSIADTPVPSIFDELYASSPSAKVILSIRDPEVWVEKRLEEHSDMEYYCREPLMHKLAMHESRHNSSRITNFNQPSIGDSKGKQQLPVLPHIFSYHKCIERAMANMKIKVHDSEETRAREESTAGQANVQPLPPTFILMRDFLSEAKKHSSRGAEHGLTLGKNILAASYHEYNEYIKSVVPAERLLVVDIWKQDACEFHDKVEKLLGSEKKKVRVKKEWRGTFIGLEVGEHLGTKKCEKCPS